MIRLWLAAPFCVGVALMVSIGAARGESRTVLIQVRQNADNAAVTIYSDVKAERKREIAIEEAVKIVADMEGFGSAVGVYLEAGSRVRAADKKQLLSTVCKNNWLNPVFLGEKLPEGARKWQLESLETE